MVVDFDLLNKHAFHHQAGSADNWKPVPSIRMQNALWASTSPIAGCAQASTWVQFAEAERAHVGGRAWEVMEIALAEQGRIGRLQFMKDVFTVPSISP